MKVAMIGAFVRIFFCYFSPLLFFSISLVEISAAGSLFLGCLGALQSKTVNRFIAYTSINHIGFILLGLCNNALIDGLQYSFLYILNYVVMSITLFIVILNFKTSNGTYIKYITDFSLLENNTIKLCLTTVLFSMAGIPPLAGFFSKYFILAGCLDSNQYLLLFVALVSSAVSTFYYLGIAIDLLKSLNFCSKKKLRDHSSIYTRILLIMSISYIICLPLVLYNVINFLLEFSLSCLQPLSYF
jgi:NADH-quinone oxidoreductase subunit N